MESADDRYHDLMAEQEEYIKAIDDGSLSLPAAKANFKRIDAELKELRKQIKPGAPLPPPPSWPEPPAAVAEMAEHPLAELFPLLDGLQFEGLCEDIKANGLHQPIIVQEGKIVDGRNRLKACTEVGVEPRFTEFEMLHLDCTVEQYIFSTNVQRRHLTDDQRAAIVLRWRERLAAEAKERQKEGGKIAGRGRAKVVADSPQPLPSGKTRTKLAELAHVSEHKIKLAEQVQKSQPELIQKVSDGNLTLAAAANQVTPPGTPTKEAATAKAQSVHFSSDSDEWCTPPEIVTPVVRLMGAIDLDPCSNSRTQPNIPATRHFTIGDDGLAHPWNGRIYMNPPYGAQISLWVEKLTKEMAAQRVTEAIALVPARVDTSWWRRFRDYPVCFVEGRLKFGGHKNSAPFPSVVVYLGPKPADFVACFRDLGDVWQRVGAKPFIPTPQPSGDRAIPATSESGEW
jgi:phage N-6-adenine-methyltransferase